MEISDAIVVLPTLFLVAIITIYAVLATYAGLVLYEQSCSKCGQTLPSEEALEEHMEEHRVAEAGLHNYPLPSAEEGKSAA